MMLNEVKEAFECDVVGNDEDYIKEVDLTTEDCYNIRRIMEKVKHNLSESVLDKFLLACAMRIYLTRERYADNGKLPYLYNDLVDNVENAIIPIYDECDKEYEQIKLERVDTDGDEECSGNSSEEL